MIMWADVIEAANRLGHWGDDLDSFEQCCDLYRKTFGPEWNTPDAACPACRSLPRRETAGQLHPRHTTPGHVGLEWTVEQVLEYHPDLKEWAMAMLLGASNQ